MKKFLFAVITLLMVHGAMGQIKVGVKAGGNLSTINTVHISCDMKFGFHIGGFAEFVMNDKISIQPELLYSTQGASATQDGVTVNANVNYINVPVLLKLNIAEGLSAEIGPQVGILVGAKQGSKNIKEDCYTFDLTAIAGLSYTFAEKFVVGARYGFGLTNISKDVKTQNRVISLSIGYKFN
jgi:opacity protein-like surface antigen